MYGYDKSISNIKGRAIDIIHTVSGEDLYNIHVVTMYIFIKRFHPKLSSIMTAFECA